MIKIYNDDCLSVLSNINENLIDLTVTSPPYDNLRTYNNSLKWNFDIFKEIANQLYRVTKQGGVVVWVVGDATIKGSETGTSFKQALYFKEVGFNLHDTMIYQKKNPVPYKHNRYNPCFEYMFILSKLKPKTVNLITEPKKNIMPGTFRQKDGTLKNANSKKVTTRKIKNNVWTYGVGRNSTKHPATFPEKLAHDHIISWSNEGDTVLDPFMGSGTTGKMAKQLNRSFIGIEKVKEYCDIAKERISYDQD